MNRYSFGLVWKGALGCLLGVALTSGCSRETTVEPYSSAQPEEEEGKHAPEQNARQGYTEDLSPSGEAKKTAPDVVAMLDTIRIASLIQRDDTEWIVGLVDDAEAIQQLVRVGDVFMGYTVLAIDGDASEAILERDGMQFKVASRSRAAEPVKEAGDVLREEMGKSAEELKAAVPDFEPTDEEIRARIDPNDPSTWPSWYQGPGIERAGLPAQYTPTESETQRGIDPNDSSTWPAGYRGPGIERAAQGQM